MTHTTHNMRLRRLGHDQNPERQRRATHFGVSAFRLSYHGVATGRSRILSRRSWQRSRISSQHGPSLALGVLSKPRAFTLIELMVSVAVLIGLMAMVAMIFSSATKASGQAQATTALYRVVEQMAENIRQDLESCTPSESILGIARVDVLAYATPADKETGRAVVADPLRPDHDWHRADMLMLVSKRKFNPYILRPQSLNDAFEEYRHVVYGHANIGRIVQTNPTTWAWPNAIGIEPANIDSASPIAASKWHLARRVTGSPTQAILTGWGGTFTDNRWGWPLTDPRYTGSDPGPTHHADVLGDHTLSPNNLILSNLIGDTAPYRVSPGIAKYGNDRLLTELYVREGVEIFRWDATTSPPHWYCLKADLATDPNHPYWWQYNSASGTWTRQIPGTTLTAAFTVTPPTYLALDDSMIGTPDPHKWPDWFYRPGTQGADRTQIDPNPPPGRSDMMAAYFLPGCSDFKVEFTYDDPREMAINSTTGDPVVTPDLDGNTQPDYDIDGKAFVDTTQPPDNAMTLADKMPVPRPVIWQSLPPLAPALSGTGSGVQVQVWNRIGVNTSDYPYNDIDGNSLDLRDYTHPYRWPRAIRITLRVWDPAGRLQDPITHVIVHTFE